MKSRGYTVILVMANSRDQVAKKLVEQWSTHNAYLMTPLDLSNSGWHYYVDDIDSSVAFIGGRKIAAHEISGVIVRLPWIALEDLNHIVPEDRTYVATEMRAFLISWLTALKCPVLNRPTPSSLLGPGWCNEKWVYTAAQLGIPVYTSKKIADLTHGNPSTANLHSENRPDDIIVTVVGKRCFGAVNKTMAEHARSLASTARVGFMEVRFSYNDYIFKGVSLCSDNITNEVADALIDYLQKSSIVPPIEVEA